MMNVRLQLVGQVAGMKWQATQVTLGRALSVKACTKDEITAHEASENQHQKQISLGTGTMQTRFPYVSSMTFFLD